MTPPWSRGDLAASYADRSDRGETVVTLPPGRVVTGRVLDAGGAPVVAWLHHRLPGGNAGTGRTREEGRFELRHLPRVPVMLAATLEWTEPRSPKPDAVTWTTLPVEESTVTLVVGERRAGHAPRSLRVRVVGPEGTPPARVQVELRTGGSVTQHPSSDGGTTFDVEPDAEAIVVRAFAAEDAEGALLPWAPSLRRVEPGETDVEVRMPAGLSIEGRVVDGGGLPVAGIRVVAFEGRIMEIEPLAGATSRDDGTFRLVGLGAGWVDLTTVATREWPAARGVRTEVGALDVQVVVRRGSPAKIRVVDPAGRPVPGAHVVVMSHRVPSEQEAEDGRAHLSGSSVVGVDTDETGHVRVPALDPTLHLSLSIEVPKDRDDLASVERDPWMPATGDVTLPPGFTATFRVLDEGGRPVRAEVQRNAAPADRPWEFAWKAGPSPDPTGFVRAPGIPTAGASFSAAAEADAGVFPRRSRWVHVDARRRDAILRIPTRGHALTVRASGTVPGQAGVLVAALGPGQTEFRELRFEEGEVARVEGVARGVYSLLVLARADGDRPATVAGRRDLFVFDGPQEVTVPTRPPGLLEVRPVLPVGAADAEGFAVFERAVGIFLRLDADGVLRTRELPAGWYTVVVGASNGSRSFEGHHVARTGVVLDLEVEEVPSR